MPRKENEFITRLVDLTRAYHDAKRGHQTQWATEYYQRYSGMMHALEYLTSPARRDRILAQYLAALDAGHLAPIVP